MGRMRTAGLILVLSGVAAGQGFHNVTEDLQAQFVHLQSVQTGAMAGGMAWFDMDGDGDDDLLLASAAGPHRLLRWDGDAFTDLSEGCGLPLPVATFGVAVGDYDNDGFPDAYFTANGPNALVHNEDGSGVFTDVTATYDVAGDAMSTSAAWADFERDGDLDLYVGNYIQVNSFPFKQGYPNNLYVNVGSRDEPYFLDLAEAIGVADQGVFGPAPDGYVNPLEGQSVHGNCLSVSTLDFDDDGDPDILVGNDFGEFTLPNRLYRNDSPRGGPLAFTDVSEEVGLADVPQYNMGINGADFDRDGDWDLYLSNLGDNALLAWQGDGYTDVVYDAGPVDGMGADGRARTSWDTIWFDYDNDGWEDLFVANGYVPGAEDFLPTEFESPNTLWHNQGDGTFEQVNVGMLGNKKLGRSTCFTDLDADGALEWYVVNNGMAYFEQGGVLFFTDGQKSHMYSVRPPPQNHWLELRLQGTVSNVEALGARIDAHLGDGVVLKRQVRSDGVYLSTPSRLVHFGLGEVDTVRKLVVDWPNGIHQERHGVPADRLYRLTEPQAGVKALHAPRATATGLGLAATLVNHGDAAREVRVDVSLQRAGRVLFAQSLRLRLDGGAQQLVELEAPIRIGAPGDAELRVDVVDVESGARDERVLEL